MNVFLYIQGRIELNNPIYLRNIKSSCCHISTKKHSFFQLPKLMESSWTLLLLLLTMDIHNTNINIIEQIRVEFNTITRRKENHYLFVLLLLQKSKKQLKFFIRLYHHKPLLQSLNSSHCLFIIYSNINWISQRQFGKIVYLLSLGCRKQNSLPFLWNRLKNLI